jgi:hypothetical protein
MEQARPKLVEVACFTEACHADLARRFLRRSGVKATVPEPLFGEGRFASRQRRLYVPENEQEKARRLLRQVVSGEFAEDDPLSGTRRGLGAALSDALRPATGYEPPSRWARLAPVILIPLAVVTWLLAIWIHQTLYPGETEPYRQTHRLVLDRWR